MAELDRRTVLRGAGIGAAAVAAMAVAPNAAFAATSEGTGAAHGADNAPDAATSTLVVHVRDSRRGELTVMAGEREVRVVDRALAQRLARLAD